LEKGEVLAYAEEVCSKVEPVGIQIVEVAEQEVQEKGKREIPEYLANLFEKSNGELNGQEQTQLRELLCEFEDVFAKSEFDMRPMPIQTPMAGSLPPPTFSLIGPLLPQTPRVYA
jgi:hypothetical protein